MGKGPLFFLKTLTLISNPNYKIQLIDDGDGAQARGNHPAVGH